MNTGGLPIINYQITYQKYPEGAITILKEFPNRMTTLQKLLPNTSYMITVRANNSILSDTDAVVNRTTKARSESEYCILQLYTIKLLNLVLLSQHKIHINRCIKDVSGKGQI